MADLATLKIGIDSRDVNNASTHLNTMKTSAGNADGALGKFGSSVKIATASQRELNNAIKSAEQTYKTAATYVSDLTMQTKRLGMSSIELKKLEIATAAANAPTLALRNSIREAGAEYLRAARSGQEFAQSGGMVGSSVGAQRAGMQQLSYQIGDVTQQFALGTSPMVIFAQQGGQVVQALSMMRGGAGGLIGFLAGPWGAVLLGATMILGTFFGKTKDAENATLNLADAINFQKMSTSELTKSIRQLSDAQEKANRTSYQSELQAYANAAGSLKQADANRIAAISYLKLAEAAFYAQSAQSKGGAEIKGALGAAVGNIQSRIKELQGEVIVARNFLKEATIPIARRAAEAATDGAAAATLRYEKAEFKLRQTLLSKNLSQSDFTKQYTRELVGLNIVKEREIQLAKDAEKEANKRLKTPKLSESQKQQIALKETIEDLRQQVELSKQGTIAEEARLKVELKRQGATEEQITTILDLTKQLKNVEEQRVETEKRIEYGNRIDDLSKELYLISTGMEMEEARLRVQLARQGALQNEINAIVQLTKEQSALKKTDDDRKKLLEDAKKALADFNNLKIDINFDAIFGNAGKAMGGVISVFDKMLERQEKYNELVKLGFKDEAERASAQQRNSRLQINQYANLISSAKGFFKEGTTGYKVMGAAEKAFRVFELVMAAKSAAVKIGLIAATTGAVVVGAATETAVTAAAEATKTGTTLAGAAVRIPVKIAEGAASIFSALGPWGFPVVAAMIGVMAALGFGGKSVSQPSIPNAEEMQAAQGTGSVLGDSTAKSDSINRALEIMAANSNSDLEYSNQMLLSLRSIQNNMANLSNNVAKQISVSGGMFDTSGQRLGKTGSSGVLGMFASSTTRELQDLGIDIVSSSIAEIIGGGIKGQTYQVIEQVKKKSGFFGIGGGTKTTYQTSTGEIDQDIRDSITGVITSLRQGLIDGAAVIGLDGAQAILDSFQVNIGKISLSGLTGQEIEEQLNAIFSKVGDQMAGALLPALTSMQQIGEGLFETFARVAREYQVVDVALRSIGKEFGAVGMASIEARSALVQMFESLDQFVEQTNYFRDNFLTEAERIAPVTQAVADELQRLGLSSISTIEQFKIAVLGLDLTSTSGQEAYAALLRLAPAFKMVADYQAELAKLQLEGVQIGVDGSKLTAESAKAALELQQKRASMEIELLEAQGRSSEALAIRRTLELNAMDETLRGLQEQIYTAQDAKAASDAATQAAKIAADEATKIATQRTNLEIQLMEALGNSTEALSAKRALELAALDESLQGLQQQIYAAQDAKAANDAAAIAAKTAADEALQSANNAMALSAQRTSLEIELMDALGNSSEALAARRALELAAMDESLQGLQKQIFAAQDARAASEAAAQITKAAAEELAQMEKAAAENAIALSEQRTRLEINLMEALGNASGALAAKRQLELAATDETLRSLQQQIYAAEDAAKAASELAEIQTKAAEELANAQAQAAEELANAQAEAAEFAAQAQAYAIELAQQRYNLEIELMEAVGDATGALAARRALELAGIDETLRGLQLQIYAAQDAAIATQELTNAQEKAAAEIQRIAEASASLARERTALEIQLLEATGNSVEALAAKRSLELSAMDETLRGLQQQIYAAQDAKIASDAAAEASKLAAETAKTIANEIAQSEKAAADQALSLANQRANLEIQLMEALGYSSEALAAKRSLELAAMDETLQALQNQIYAAQDARIARDEALKSAEDAAQAEKVIADDLARAAMVAAENAAKLAEQRTNLEIELMEALGNSSQALAAKRAIELGNMDESLRGLQQQIYAAQDAKVANDEATQAAQKYQDTLANVTKTVLDEINRLRGVNVATSSVLLKAQFATLTAQARTGNLDALGKLPELSRSIEEATLGTASSALEVARIRAWLANSLTETLAQQNPSASMVEATDASLTFDGNNSISANTQQTSGEISEMSNALYTALYQIAKNTGKTSDQLNRWDGDGLPEVRNYTV